MYRWLKRPNLLFVCTANLCRSPLAEAMCLASVKRLGWRVSSAGFFSDEGAPVASGSLDTLSRHQFAPRDLRSHGLTFKMVRQASHIFVMEAKHLDSLRKSFPASEGKTYLVTSFCRSDKYRNQDVPDPVGGDESDFEETYRVLSDAVPRLIDFVKRQG